MYDNIKAALDYLISTYGLHVLPSGDGKRIYWSLYSQGSGVAFDARVSDWKLVWKHMLAEGRLDSAARLSGAVDDDELNLTIRHTDNRYTHSRSMDVEVDGPRNSEDEEADAAAVTELVKSVKEIVESASDACHDLLSNYLLLSTDGKEVLAHETKHFRVVVRQIADDGDETLDWELEGLTGQEAVERMTELTRNAGEYQAGSIEVRVYHRVDVDDDWEEVADSTYSAFPYRTTEAYALLRSSRQEVADTILQAREALGITKTKPTHELKEAA